jgi:hypothetical protein
MMGYHRMKGIAGHTGLFSTADDLASLFSPETHGIRGALDARVFRFNPPQV